MWLPSKCECYNDILNWVNSIQFTVEPLVLWQDTDAFPRRLELIINAMFPLNFHICCAKIMFYTLGVRPFQNWTHLAFLTEHRANVRIQRAKSLGRQPWRATLTELFKHILSNMAVVIWTGNVQHSLSVCPTVGLLSAPPFRRVTRESTPFWSPDPPRAIPHRDSGRSRDWSRDSGRSRDVCRAAQWWIKLL